MSELKLGLILPPKIDDRTIPLSAILKTEQLPPLPVSYDVDETLGGIEDNFMFNNSIYGDCVIAQQAHFILRLEKYEQGTQIPIADKEVTDEYFRQSGGADNGLYMLNAMKEWRNHGILIGDKVYYIYAFAKAEPLDHTQIKYCIYLFNGLPFGMQVYQTDINQFYASEPWHLTNNNGAFRGGHGVYTFSYKTQHNDCPHCLTGWNEDGLTCMTWGKKQFIEWPFWDSRVQEAYGIVDQRDKWLGDSPVDVVKLDAYLHEITGNSNSGCSIWPFSVLNKIGNSFNKGRG